MLTQERAQYLWNIRGYQWHIPKAFKINSLDPDPQPDGMTEKEWEYVRKVWKTMPAYTCFMDAFFRILKGEKI